jgi:hypothetical protein
MSEYKVPIFLAPEIRSAVNQYGVKNDIDKIYVVQQCILKTLHNEGFISKEVFEYYMPKYSRTISSMSERPQKPLNQAEQKQKQTVDEKNRLFASVISQWELSHKVGWRESWIEQAEFWSEQCPEAKRLLEKIACKVFVK